jgi:oligoribonuclease
MAAVRTWVWRALKRVLIRDGRLAAAVCRRWFPREYGKSPRKRQAHTAMSDIRESIDQLRYYRKAVFKPSR